MPVNHRRLGQPVREFDLQRDALLRFQDGTGHLTVESVAADFAAGSNLPIDFTRLQAVPDDTSAFRRCSAIAAHEFPLSVSKADVMDINGMTCVWRRGGPRLHRAGDGAPTSCLRQATKTSQTIHTTSRTQASTIAIFIVCEKPSEPTTQPCAR